MWKERTRCWVGDKEKGREGGEMQGSKGGRMGGRRECQGEILRKVRRCVRELETIEVRGDKEGKNKGV